MRKQRLISKFALLICVLTLNGCFLFEISKRCEKQRTEYWKACTEGYQGACEQYYSSAGFIGGLLYELPEAALVISGKVDDRREFFRQQGALWKSCKEGNSAACKEAKRCDIIGTYIYCSKDPVTPDWQQELGSSGSADPDDPMEGMCPAVNTPKKPPDPCQAIRKKEFEELECPMCKADGITTIMVQKRSPSVWPNFHFWQYDCVKHTTHSGSRFPNPHKDKWCNEKK